MLLCPSVSQHCSVFCILYYSFVLLCFILSTLRTDFSGKPFKLPPELKSLLTKQKKRKRDNGAPIRFGSTQLSPIVEFCGKDCVYQHARFYVTFYRIIRSLVLYLFAYVVLDSLVCFYI